MLVLGKAEALPKAHLPKLGAEDGPGGGQVLLVLIVVIKIIYRLLPGGGKAAQPAIVAGDDLFLDRKSVV